MSDDELDYDDVIDVWEREKDTTQPCALPENFYPRLRGYIQDLEEKTKDIETPPKNKRERMVQKQYESVVKIADHFFKERQKKIVLSAYHRSLGEDVNTENLLDRELELLDDISGLLKELKNLMFHGEYKRKTKSDDKTKEEKKKSEQAGKNGGENKEIGKDHSKTIDKTTSEDERNLEAEVEAHEELLVYITENVPPFVDVDNTYELEKEDVVTLEESIAQVLIERGKARKVKL